MLPGAPERFEKSAQIDYEAVRLIRSRILERRLQVSFQMRIMKNLLLRNGCMSTVYLYAETEK